jgi:hypothetical protein
MFSDRRWFAIQLLDRAKLFGLVALGFALLVAYDLAHWNFGEPRYFVGTVQTTGVVSVASLAGGNAQGATIALPSGKIVTVYIHHSVEPLRVGQTVKVEEQPLLFAPSVYGVVWE